MRFHACLLPLGLAVAAQAQAAAPFALTSQDIRPGSFISNDFIADFSGCTGRNLSPALSWHGAPDGTRSFAITVKDTDAPGSGDFWHWAIYDIPAAVRSLPTGAAHSGTQPAGARMGTNDYGTFAYGGPCPPPGDPPHHYAFTVYALNISKLGLPANPADAAVAAAARAAAIATASFTARYGR